MAIKAKTGELFLRVYNNKMIKTVNDKEEVLQDDEAMLVAVVNRLFGSGLENGDPSLLHQFNNLIVQTADQIAFGRFQDILSIFATYDRVASRNDVKEYKIPKKVKSRFRWSALASGVHMQRHENEESVFATPTNFQAGFSYNPNDLLASTVENFRKLVNDIAEAKFKFLVSKFYEIVDASAISGAIPARNTVSGTNLTATELNGVTSSLARIGRSRAVVVGDTLMIDSIASTLAKNFNTTFTAEIPDSAKEMLYRDLNYTNLGRADAITLWNDFTDETLVATELPVDKSFVMASGLSVKPFVVTDYGTMTQKLAQDFETDTVELILGMSFSIMLLHGEAMGYLEDDAIVL